MTDSQAPQPEAGLTLSMPASFPGAAKHLAHRLAQLVDKCRPGYCVSNGVRNQIEECHTVALATVFAIENQPAAGTSAADDWCRTHGYPTYGDIATELGYVEKQMQEIRSAVMGEDWGGNLGARLIGEVLDHIRAMRDKAAA